MKGFFPAVLCLVLIIISAPNSRADNKTLDSLIKAALAANPDIRAAEYQRQAAEYEAGATGKLPDPVLSLGAVNLPKSSLSFDETPMSAVVVGLSQTVPWPGKLKKKSSLARLDSQFKQTVINSEENAVVRMVTSSYYEYAYWKEAREIIERNQALVGSLAEVVETRFANGFGSAGDLLRARTLQARLENRLLNIDRMIYSSLLSLGTLTGNPATAGTDLPASFDKEIIAGDEITDDGVKGNPLLAGAALKTEQARNKIDLTKSDYWPDFTFGIDYSIRRDIPGDPVRGEDYLSFKVGLRLPLWFSKQKSNTRAAREEFQAAREQERSMQLRLWQTVNDIRSKLSLVERSYRRYRESIHPQAEAAYESARVAYEVGRVDFNSLLSIQIELLDIELEQLSLVKDYYISLAEYEELTGKRYNR
ncbi:MAG: TolC family protein [candidate division Zixibacteria bacterium]|nr:TolC family protein [candidate division Zixibacteria bacterium]